jgi:hypothetical protein
MGCGLQSRVFGHFIQPKPSNQLSNNRPRQRQTPVDASGRYVAVQEEDKKAKAVDRPWPKARPGARAANLRSSIPAPVRRMAENKGARLTRYCRAARIVVCGSRGSGRNT